MQLDLTVDFLIRTCGIGNFQILSNGPIDVNGQIGTQYRIKVKDIFFECACCGSWAERESSFRYLFIMWYRLHVLGHGRPRYTLDGEEVIEIDWELAA